MDRLSAEQRVTIVNMSPRDMTIEPRQPPLSYFFPTEKTRPKFRLGKVDVTNETHLQCSFAEWAQRPKFGVDHLHFTLVGDWTEQPRTWSCLHGHETGQDLCYDYAARSYKHEKDRHGYADDETSRDVYSNASGLLHTPDAASYD